MSLRLKYLTSTILGILFEALVLVLFFNSYEKRRDTHLLQTVTETKNILVKSYHESEQASDLIKSIQDSFDTLNCIEGYSLQTIEGDIILEKGITELLNESKEESVKRVNFNTFTLSTHLGLEYIMNYTIHPNIDKKEAVYLVFIILLIFSFMLITYMLFDYLVLKKLKYLISFLGTVQEDKDLSLRLENSPKDEIGSLYNAVNSLLKQIEEYDISRSRSNDKLKRAKEEAEGADRLKSAFLANMSHEIRTPMNSIIGFTDLLGQENLKEEKKERYIELIQSNSNSLLNLITDIVDLSKIEANQLEVKFSNVNINKLFEEAFQIFNEDLDFQLKNSVQLKLNIPKTVVYMHTDFYRLKQVLTNLLSNAIKFTDKGIVEFGFVKSGKNVSMYFKDSGIGIPEEYKERIFDHFHKVEDDTDRLYRGAGLGLSITKKIIELLGGSISLESRVNYGSKFILNFKSVNNNSEEVAKENFQLIDYKNLSGKTVLIAEDEESNYIFLEELLREKNIKPIWVQDGNKAVAICKKRPEIDLVIMDIKMPVMDGFDATKKIKSLIPELPIIALSALKISDEDKSDMKEYINEYLSKPIKADKLFRSIHKLLA